MLIEVYNQDPIEIPEDIFDIQDNIDFLEDEYDLENIAMYCISPQEPDYDPETASIWIPGYMEPTMVVDIPNFIPKVVLISEDTSSLSECRVCKWDSSYHLPFSLDKLDPNYSIPDRVNFKVDDNDNIYRTVVARAGDRSIAEYLKLTRKFDGEYIVYYNLCNLSLIE